MTPDPRTGLFSSSLVKQPTSEEIENQGRSRKLYSAETEKRLDRSLRHMEHRIPPANDVELAFRHGAWVEDRDRVRAALLAAHVPASRIERFDGCGGQCRVEYSPSAEKFRVRANYCGDRFCIPCMRSRGKKVVANLLEWTQGETTRFGTLTLARTSESLQVRLNHLLASFKRLREHGFWKNAVRGGIAVIEITRGDAGDFWHVHLHFLAVGGRIDWEELRDGWRKATGDSIIVHIRAVPDHQRGAEYVAGYATKGWSQDVLEDADALIECVLSLRGRRLLITFGEWYGRDDQLCKVQPRDWKMVGWIRRIYADSLEGKPWAVGLLRTFGIAAGSVNGAPVFVGSPPSWSGP